MAPPRTDHRLAIDLLRTRPALRRSQDNYRPDCPVADIARSGLGLDASNFRDHRVERCGEKLVDGCRIVAFDEVRHIAVAFK